MSRPSFQSSIDPKNSYWLIGVMIASKMLAYIVVLVLLWQSIVSLFDVAPYLVPPPLEVGRSLVELPNYYFKHTAVTFTESALGILVGFFAGLLLGVVMHYGGLVGRLLTPLVVASQVFPKESLAPLFLVIFGFGIFPKVLISALICFFPVAINTQQGLASTPDAYLRLMHVSGASSFQCFWHCVLPFSLKYIAASGRVCAVLGLIGAVVGEFVGASAGLGHVIRASYADISTERVFASLILLGTIGGLFYGIAAFADSVLLRRFETKRYLGA